MTDPIEEVYLLFRLSKRPEWPVELKSEAERLDDRIRALARADTSDWVDYYRELLALTERIPTDGDAPDLDSATRGLVDGYIRQAQEAPRYTRDLWLGRIDRQREFLKGEMDKQLRRLDLSMTEDGGRLAVELSENEAAAWSGWVEDTARSWATQVSEGVPHHLHEKSDELVAPSRKWLSEEEATIPRPEMEPTALPDFAQYERRVDVRLPSKMETFVRSLRGSVFGLLMIAGMALSVAGAAWGVSGRDARGVAFVVLLPILAIVAWRQATSEAETARDREGERLTEMFRRKLANEADTHLQSTWRAIRGRTERYLQDASQLAARWATETTYSLNQRTASRPAATASGPKLAHRLQSEVVPAIEKRIATLEAR